MPRLAFPTFAQATLKIEGEKNLINCWFNPNQYSISKQNSWPLEKVVGEPLPVPQFGGGQPRRLTLDLLFDAPHKGHDDVRGVTASLFRMMEINPNLDSGKAKNSGRPPMVTFAWGGTMTFEAVAEQLSVQYTLFRPDGSPIRAQAKLSLIQVGKAQDGSSSPPGGGGQNPTTRGIAGVRSHVVRDGDSLQSIAHGAYGDPTRWRAIAETNGIDDPMHLRRGSTLSIPRITE